MDRNHLASCQPLTAISAAAKAVETANGDNGADNERGGRPEIAAKGLLGLVPEEQLAVELNRMTTTLRRWRKHGTGPPYVPVGREIFYRILAVEAWLMSREQGGSRPKQRRSRRTDRPPP